MRKSGRCVLVEPTNVKFTRDAGLLYAANNLSPLTHPLPFQSAMRHVRLFWRQKEKKQGWETRKFETYHDPGPVITSISGEQGAEVRAESPWWERETK